MRLSKKALVTVLAVALALTMALGGTLAYLTDTDADVNTMVLGNVQIVQNEQERVKDENGEFTSELQPFTNNQTIYPAVYEVVAGDQNKVPLTVNDYEIKIREFPNYVDKLVSVTNTGASDAYVRTIVAIPQGLTDYENSTGDNVSEAWLHWNSITDKDTTKNNGWYLGNDENRLEYPPAAERYSISDVEINGSLYTVTVFTNINPIAPGETTGPCMAGFYMDNNVDYQDGKYVWRDKETGETIEVWNKDKVDILVLSQAVQAQGFDNAYDALKAAFGDVDATKAATWFGGLYNEDGSVNEDAIGSPGDKNDTNNPPVTTTVADATELKAAIANAQPGETIVLTNDTLVEGYAATNKLVLDGAFTLDLNGNTLTTESGWGGIDAKGGCSIKNGTINHTGNTAAIKAFDVKSIENVVINVKETPDKTKGGIVVQNGTSSVGTIKNVTINGATNGIEIYQNSAEQPIGVIDNVTINAEKIGLWLNGSGKIGEIKNSEIVGGITGIQGDLKGLWHIDLNLTNTKVTGTQNYGIDLWDEAPANTGSTVTLNYDEATSFTGGIKGIKITLNDEVSCKVNGENYVSAN